MIFKIVDLYYRLHEDRGLLDLDGTFNPLNQLTALRYSGKLDVVGQVAGTNGPFTVKVDGEPATIYQGTNFHGGGRVKPGMNTVSIVTTDASTNRNETLRHSTFPPTNPQTFQYDANGNMTSDGLCNYTWNEENKLVAIESGSGIPAALKKRSEFAYDAQSRMFERKDYSGYTNGSYSATNIIHYIWDGYNIISEISCSDTPSLNYTNSYIWGLELSGTLQGAGGVGGLLAQASGTNVFMPTYDGNGNIGDVYRISSAAPPIQAAHFEYDPFGRLIFSTAPPDLHFPFRFSTKPYDVVWV